jgi:UDP-N-acetylbacillosamine N-acetyltransferase
LILQEGYIFGGGAQGRVALDVLKLQYPHTNWFFIDDNPSMKDKKINNVLVYGNLDSLKNKGNCHIHIALGKPGLKDLVTQRCKTLNLSLISAIHPSAIISQNVRLGEGIFIGAGAIINTDAYIGDGVLINTGSVIEHDSVVGDFANISPAVCIGGRVNIAKKVFVGSGAIVFARVTVDENSIIGMGAVVNKNIPANTLAYGVPAREIKKIDEHFDWNKIL